MNKRKTCKNNNASNFIHVINSNVLVLIYFLLAYELALSSDVASKLSAF